ncbi:MAG: hypothetical protein KJ069_01350 [Anaerolineae bacterium]|nr:hypothetical protein [Anaerolineae bacterium]
MVSRFDTLEADKQQKNDLLALRNRLKELQAWPAAGDDLLNLVPELYWHSTPLTDSDNEWLPLVVRDSLRGVDIGFQYPAFFQKLLLNPGLRRLFLSEIERATAAR